MKQHNVAILDRKKVNAIPLRATSTDTTTTDEEIRRHAYELYERHGRQDGREMDDWLEAEREIRKTRAAVA